MTDRIVQTAAALAAGTTTSRALTEACLARIADSAAQGGATFVRFYRDAALAAADASDRLRGFGTVPSPLAGIPISIKDLFDVAGETTLAGSIALRDEPPARHDATIVARLRRAGAIIVGRTNMTEFAFSGIGININYGTPLNPWDRTTGRIPGGSSSGAAVSVADAMALAAIGTDTGGSVRIPAALCGVTGFKPTARRVPLDGCFPLSGSLDSIGPLANSVSCCALVDAVLADELPELPSTLPMAGLRLGVPRHLVLDALDDAVAAAFASALARLSAAGARVIEFDFQTLTTLGEVNRTGGFAVLEAYALHRQRIGAHPADYDPRIGSRILRGRHASAADYIELLAQRRAYVAEAARRFEPFDAVLMPSVPMIAPTVASLATDDAAYFAANARTLRNTTVINFLDGCALSIPCHAPATAPVGLMVAGVSSADRRILQVGMAIETTLASR